MGKLVRRIGLVLVVIAAVAAVLLAMRPAPVPVDLGEVTRGRLLVTADDDGRTRIKERYVISAPLNGRLLRVQLHPGDDAIGGETLLAAIEPVAPELLDTRALAEADARVKAGRAGVEQAERDLERGRKMYEQAQQDYDRTRGAHDRKAATWKELEHAENLSVVRGKELDAATSARDVAQYRLQLAEAALIRTKPPADGAYDTSQFEIRAPSDGRILRVFRESAGFVSAGTPLLEFGDPLDLEIVVDLLSTEAVQVEPGADVIIEGWGGEHDLHGQVRVVEPSAFTKISALGVEEQRVNVIIDFVDPPDERSTLGDGYRVDARIVLWEGPDVVRVPTSALFRTGDDWSVFVVEADQAKLRTVAVGARNDLAAEVIDGLEPGAVVIVHPSDRIEDEVMVRTR